MILFGLTTPSHIFQDAHCIALSTEPDEDVIPEELCESQEHSTESDEAHRSQESDHEQVITAVEIYIHF